MPDKNDNEPIISDEELKMPEQPFGVQSQLSKKPSVLGPILGALIIVLVLILGGLYLWGSTFIDQEPAPTPAPTRPTPEENNEPESNNAEADVQIFETVSVSDEIDAIEADLESTNLNSLDAELNSIDAELNASDTQ